MSGRGDEIDRVDNDYYGEGDGGDIYSSQGLRNVLLILNSNPRRQSYPSRLSGHRGGVHSSFPFDMLRSSGCEGENCPRCASVQHLVYGLTDNGRDDYDDPEMDGQTASPDANVPEGNQPIAQLLEKACEKSDSKFVKDLWGKSSQEEENSTDRKDISDSKANDDKTKEEKHTSSAKAKTEEGDVFCNVFRDPDRRRIESNTRSEDDADTESSGGTESYSYQDSPLINLVTSLMFGRSERNENLPVRHSQKKQISIKLKMESTQEKPQKKKQPTKSTSQSFTCKEQTQVTQEDEHKSNMSPEKSLTKEKPNNTELNELKTLPKEVQSQDESNIKSQKHEAQDKQTVEDQKIVLPRQGSLETATDDVKQGESIQRNIKGSKSLDDTKTGKKKGQKEKVQDNKTKKYNPIFAPLFTWSGEQSSLSMFSGESEKNLESEAGREWTIRDIMDEKLPAVNEDGEEYGMFNVLSSVATGSGRKVVDQLGRTLKVIGRGGSSGDVVDMPALFVALKDFAAANCLELKDGTPDGNCMFQSVADQLKVRAVEPDHSATSLRHQAVLYLRDHPNHEDGTPLEQFLSTETWTMYLSRMSQPSQWGDHMILRAMSNMLNRNIIVCNVKGDGEVTQHEIVPVDKNDVKKETLYLGHLGEFHYMSLRPQNWEEEWLAKAKQRRKEHGLGVLHASNEEDTEETLFQLRSDMTHVDQVSGVPLPHLSFLLDYALLVENIITITLHADKLQITDYDGSVYPQEMFGSGLDRSKCILRDNTLDENLKSYHNTKWRCTPKTVFLNKYLTVHCEDGSYEGKPNIVADETSSHPGYCRLQPLIQSSQVTGKYVVDTENGTVFLTAPDLGNLRYGDKVQEVRCMVNEDKNTLSITKPDLKHKVEKTQFEYIFGYRCDNWPKLAIEWISRDRPANWPPQRLRERLLREKCFVIQRAHPLSESALTEWQFIFFKAEKLLFTEALSKEQLECYQRFRVLVDYYTRHVSCRLSSIHLKSIFFYSCEFIPVSYWTDSLGGCFLYLVGSLLQCVRERKLPNYFIRENNMIDHMTSENLQELQTALESIRRFPIECITFMSERHGYHDGWLSKYIMMDIPIYVDDVLRDLNRVSQRVFVPGVLRVAMRFANKERYSEALSMLNAAYEQLLMTPPAPDGRQTRMPRDATHFIKEVINNIDCDTTKHLFGSFIEKLTGVEIVKTSREKDFMRIKDLTAGENLGGIGEAPVPKQYRGSPLLQAQYLDLLAFQMFSHSKFPESGAYLGHAIYLIDNALTNGLMDLEAIEDPDLQREVSSQSYQNSCALTNFLIQILQHLQCLPLPGLMTTKLTQIEDICERFPNPGVVSMVIDSWKRSGNPERAKELQTKYRDLLETNSTHYSYYDPYSQTQYI